MSLFSVLGSADRVLLAGVSSRKATSIAICAREASCENPSISTSVLGGRGFGPQQQQQPGMLSAQGSFMFVHVKSSCLCCNNDVRCDGQ